MIYHTAQRKKIYEILKANPHVFYTAKELAEILKQDDVSISAVYRNLSALAKEGAVKKIGKKDSQEFVFRYALSDACRGKIHLNCVKCGQVFHMNDETEHILRESLLENAGFKIDETKTVICGVCPRCAEK